MINEFEVKTPDEDTIKIVCNNYGNGMIFHYRADDNHCYQMETMGNPCAEEVRELIKKYDHNK
jgi:hypothetical protein